MVQQHIYGIYYHLQLIMTMIETSGKLQSSAALPLRRPLLTLPCKMHVVVSPRRFLVDFIEFLNENL